MLSESTGTVDVHAHALPERAVQRLHEISAAHAPSLLPQADGAWAVVTLGTLQYQPFPRGGWDADARLRWMDERHIDHQVLSPIPFTYGYDLPPALGQAFARVQNEEIAAWVAEHPDRFSGLATLPLQDVPAAVAELTHALDVLGLRGALIGTHVDGANLDVPELDPLWAVAAERGALVFLHPWQVAGAERLGRYYLTNVVGNPAETTAAAASLVFGGVLRRHPRLSVCLPHGGGFLPYQRGRAEHAWRVQPQTRAVLADDPPGPYFDRFYIDGIVFSDPALAFLIRAHGSGRVLLGSDYPFGMGLDDPVGAIHRVPDLAPAERNAILGATARRLLGLDGSLVAAAPQESRR